MRALVFLLVLANLLFFAYGQGYFGRPDNPDAGRIQQQLNPDRIRIMARGEPPTLRGTEKEAAVAAGNPPPTDKSLAPESSASPEGCVAWDELSIADANRLAGVLGEKFPDFRVARRAQSTESAGWWVYIPPLSSKADADRKVTELRRLGVNDYFIIQEAGPNRFAISLGIFSSEAAAGEHLAGLRAKGLKSAKAGPRLGKLVPQTIEARGPVARRSALLAAAGVVLPESEAQACADRP